MIENELTPKQLKEKEFLEKEANLIKKDYILIFKACLVVSLLIMIGLLFKSVFI